MLTLPLPCQAEAAKEIPGHGKVREIERRLASRLLEEVSLRWVVSHLEPFFGRAFQHWAFPALAW